jgi:hypothetical protein
MNFARSLFARLMLVFALSIAMAGTGVAHRTAPADAGLLAYIAAGGSYADICGDTDGRSAVQTCEACRLVDTMAVPSAATGCGVAIQTDTYLAPQTGSQSHFSTVFDPNRPVRAPPAV